jgi:hypothetical protein
MMRETMIRKTTNPIDPKPPKPLESNSPMSPKSSDPDPEEPPYRLPLLHDPDELEREPLLPRELLEPPLKELPPPGRRAAPAPVAIDTHATPAARAKAVARRNRLMRMARRGAR